MDKAKSSSIVTALALVFALSGCVHPALVEFNAWNTSATAQAEAGAIKWSDHYREAFKRLAAMPDSVKGRSELMNDMNTLIQAAELTEAGRMDPIVFQGIQRSFQASQARIAERNHSNSSVAAGEALRNFGNTVYGPDATRARQIQPQPAPSTFTSCRNTGSTVNCTSY